MKKKLVSLVLAASMALGLAACGNSGTNTPAGTDSGNAGGGGNDDRQRLCGDAGRRWFFCI